MRKISILLVEDHAVVRDGLKALLNNESDMEIVGEAANGMQAVTLAKKTCPDIVIMDLAMPGMNGLKATREILKAVPSARVLVLTSYNDDECVAELMKAGAAGYLVKQTAAAELPSAIREVRRGGPCYSPSIARRLRELDRMALENGGDRNSPVELTARELEVLGLVAQGFSNREAADKLKISIKTIEKHRQQVMNKLNIHEVAGLTRYAIAQGILPAGLPRPVHAMAV